MFPRTVFYWPMVQCRRDEIAHVLHHKIPRSNFADEAKVLVDEIAARIIQARPLAAGRKTLTRRASHHQFDFTRPKSKITKLRARQFCHVPFDQCQRRAIPPNGCATPRINFDGERWMHSCHFQSQIKPHCSAKKRPDFRRRLARIRFRLRGVSVRFGVQTHTAA